MLFFGLLLNSLGVEKWKYSLNRLKKKIILFLLFLGLILFLFIVFTGIKIIKQNRIGGITLIFLGSIFCLVMVILLYIFFMLGINF